MLNSTLESPGKLNQSGVSIVGERALFAEKGIRLLPVPSYYTSGCGPEIPSGTPPIVPLVVVRGAHDEVSNTIHSISVNRMIYSARLV